MKYSGQGKYAGIKILLVFFIFLLCSIPSLTNAQIDPAKIIEVVLNPAGAGVAAGVNAAQGGVEGMIAGAFDFSLKGIVVIVGWLATGLQAIMSVVLRFCAYILDVAMQFSIYGLSDIVRNQKDAITAAWTVFRDLANIGFVFVMLYIAINFILQSDSSDTKKMLSSVIIAAFLVNFSFFFTGIIIDTANQFAIMFNNQLVQEIKTGTGGSTSISEFIVQKTKTESVITNIQKSFKMGDIASAVLNPAGAGATAGVAAGANAATNDTFTDSFNWSVGMILSVVLMVVLSFVFIIAAFMVISRTIVLIILLIVSPIGIAGKIHPTFEKLSKEWWDSLIGNAFFLPAFLLFTVIAFKLMNTGMLETVGESISGVTSGSLLSNTSAGAGGGTENLTKSIYTIAGGFVTYAIVIGFFLAALQSAKKLSSMGSDAISKLSASITQTVGGAAMGGVAFAGRNTIGRMARGALASDAVQNFAAKNRILGGLTLRGLDGVAGSSLDFRGTGAFKGVASATGVGADFLGKAGGKDGIKGQDKWLSGQYAKSAELIELGEKRKAAIPQEVRDSHAQTLRDARAAVRTAQSDLATATTSGASPAVIAKAQSKLNKATSELNEHKKKKIEDLIDKAIKEEVKDRKRAYADAVEELSGSNLSKILGIDVPQSEAADKIRKGVKASATDRAWDTLKAEMAKAAKSGP
jgi:hypothetical protein